MSLSIIFILMLSVASSLSQNVPDDAGSPLRHLTTKKEEMVDAKPELTECHNCRHLKERSAEAEKEKRQENFFGTCTQAVYYDWYYSKYPQKCRYLMENIQFEQERYLIYCDRQCGPQYLGFLRSCAGESDVQLVDYYQNLCYDNSNGVPCAYYFLAREKLQPGYYVERDCQAAFGNETECSFDCFLSLHQFKNQLGCCVNNVYNHSGVANVTDFGLWSKCGVTTPGTCSGSKALISSLLITTFFVNLAMASQY